ncbi:Uncharacterized protein TPAR_07786 [Tolypocladium paradoxum]|uniref:Thioesterase domain-containing protein n=1 Tax=Tolypocladium paradoxum TaxID=94208 RepID=A0A2S4KP99_9HYPO|nr:Uncharacterized protein TPAR_07786 [Tolypocladium paradoxum]
MWKSLLRLHSTYLDHVLARRTRLAMVPRTALRPGHLRAAGVGFQTQRWASYDKAALTKAALVQAVEAGLGEDTRGNSLRIDAESKTISTAAGSLPMSPVFDPVWMKARRRQQKEDPSKPMGRFRKKLANNPYARALGTPIRRCPITATSLPRYFLQDFELVKHPSTDAAWWAPGPLSFEFVQKKTPTAGHDDEVDAQSEADQVASPNQGDTRSRTAPSQHEPAGEDLQSTGRPSRGPITSYTLCRQSVVDSLGGPSKKKVALLLAVRSGMAVAPDTRNTVWRQDMGQVLLRMLRRHAVDALIARTCRTEESRDTFIHPCADWEQAKDVKLRGCVLWLPETQKDATRQYATLDVEGARYGQKMAVHNLRWLLGDEEAERLRREAPMFRDHEILVLRQWKSVGVMRLHLLLWRLQGYLAQPPQADGSSRPAPAAMRDENPEMMQPEDWARPDSFSGSSTPVFLIHDGGGTTFAYHCLDPLYRFVYGIRNPHFFCGSSFAGGLPEMGRLYAKCIKRAASQANFPAKSSATGSIDVLLGGWSLGGLLSLEVAKVLADDRLVRVVGILMIDSVYPRRPGSFAGVTAPLDTSEHAKSKNQLLSQRCMAEALRMVGEWDVPVWDGRLTGKRPRTVLLRATGHVPTAGYGISALDVNREDGMLGWGDHDDTMFEAVLDVAGHHFDLFAPERIYATTAAIRHGLDKLDEAAFPRRHQGGLKQMLQGC